MPVPNEKADFINQVDRSKLMQKGIAPALLVLFAILGVFEGFLAVRASIRDKDGDIGRQWTTLQYVLRGVNPYPVALDALRMTYGNLAPKGAVHLRDTKVFNIPRSGPHPDTISSLGPPEATYPPTAMIAMLPVAFINVELLRAMWLALNLLLLVLVARELSLFIGVTGFASVLTLAGVAAWPAVASCLERQQFSLLVLWAILVANRLDEKSPVLSGLLYSLALIKPSVTIPFLLLPLLARKVAALATVAVTQLALLIAMSIKVHADPIGLIREWISVAAYFRQGMYTSQDMINGLRLDGSLVDLLVPIAWLVFAYLAGKRLDPYLRMGFISVVSCVWAYHSAYDFVVLLVPLAQLIRAPLNIRWATKAGALLLIGFGLTSLVYGGTSIAARSVRWATRMSVVALIIVLARKESPRNVTLEYFAIPGTR